MEKEHFLHEIAITAIILKDGKYLITRRSKNKKRFPLMWTVPGGKLQSSDYLKLPKDTEFYWYNVLERTLKREIKEEVGLKIDNIVYGSALIGILMLGWFASASSPRALGNLDLFRSFDPCHKFQ